MGGSLSMSYSEKSMRGERGGWYAKIPVNKTPVNQETQKYAQKGEGRGDARLVPPNTMNHKTHALNLKTEMQGL